MEPLWKSELTETLPDGTERYAIIKTRPTRHWASTTPKEHTCPYCGRTIYYRFDTETLVKGAYLADHAREEESV